MSSGNIFQTISNPSNASLGTSSNTTKQNIARTTSNVNDKRMLLLVLVKVSKRNIYSCKDIGRSIS